MQYIHMNIKLAISIIYKHTSSSLYYIYSLPHSKSTQSMRDGLKKERKCSQNAGLVSRKAYEEMKLHTSNKCTYVYSPTYILHTFLLKQIAINPKHENVLKRPKEEKNSSSQFLPADDDNNKVYTFF